jgi:hypothetical protein
VDAYHVPDLDAAVARVLRTGGMFVTVTNGDSHLADLLVAAGGEPLHTQFSTENGEESLRRHFGQIYRDDFSSIAHFTAHSAAVRMLATFSDQLAANLPFFDGKREYSGASTLFVASTHADCRSGQGISTTDARA